MDFKGFQLQDLPYCALKVVFGYLSYEQVTDMKVMCRSFRKVAENNLMLGLRSALAYIELKYEKLEKKKCVAGVAIVKKLFLEFLYMKLEIFNSKLKLEMMIETERVDRYFPGHILDLFYKTERLILKSRLRPMAPIFGRFSQSVDKAVSQFEAKIQPELEESRKIFWDQSFGFESLRDRNMEHFKRLERSCDEVTKFEENLTKDRRTLKRKRIASKKLKAAKKAKLE